MRITVYLYWQNYIEQVNVEAFNTSLIALSFNCFYDWFLCSTDRTPIGRFFHLFFLNLKWWDNSIFGSSAMHYSKGTFQTASLVLIKFSVDTNWSERSTNVKNNIKHNLNVMNTHKKEQHLLHLINNAYNVCSVVMLANAKSSGKANNCHERHRKKLRERSSQQIENLQSSKMLASTKHTHTIRIDEKKKKK